MKKLFGTARALLESFAIVALTFFLGMVLCAAALLLAQAWLIPTLGRLSYEWFLYFEKMGSCPP